MHAPVTSMPAAFDVESIRAQFPILHRKAHGHPLIYFDNAATTQKPQVVIDVIRRYYEHDNANIHRGVHMLSQHATEAYEESRRKIARFINAAEDREIIFTRGTTESINLVAATWGRKFLTPGDEILLSAMEHHSNIVPWQMIAEQTGAIVRVIPMNDRGELELDQFHRLLNPRTKIMAIVHLSNSLGTINPIKPMIAKAHEYGVAVLVDGAQWVAHAPTDVQDLDADFYAFSGHKLYGPTGIGVLYGKAKLLESMPPYQGGGDMISNVTFEKTTYNVIPHKFEAGTPHIEGGIGLGAAVDFVSTVGLPGIAEYESRLLAHGTKKLSEIPGLRLVGTAREKGSVLSFVIEKPPIASLDIGSFLDARGIAVRTGHHCCQPVMDRFSIGSTTRASLAMYNTIAELDTLADALKELVKTQSAKAPRRVSEKFVWPEATAKTPETAAQTLIETFELFGDWEQRHEYLIELGTKLPPLPPEARTEVNRVRGCMSLVHLIARPQPNKPQALQFLADSDADIVRGLIAVLEQVYSGQSARSVLDHDPTQMLHRLGLDEHLSMGRRNGLAGMIQRIRSEAAKLAAAEKSHA